MKIKIVNEQELYKLTKNMEREKNSQYATGEKDFKGFDGFGFWRIQKDSVRKDKFFLAMDNNEIIGILCLQFSSQHTPNTNRWIVATLDVRKDYNGKDITGLLVDKLAESVTENMVVIRHQGMEQFGVREKLQIANMNCEYWDDLWEFAKAYK